MIQKLSFGQTVYKIGVTVFHYCDLDLDPMIFTSEHDLDIVVTYLNTKNEVNRSNGSKVIIQTDRHEWNHYLTTFAGGNKWHIYYEMTNHENK